MDKLVLKHLSCYLPYGLKIKTDKYGMKRMNRLEVEGSIKVWCLDTTTLHGSKLKEDPDNRFEGCSGRGFFLSEIKPILRPLSDYYDINSPAMNDLNLDISDQIWLVNLADGTYHVDDLPYRLACILAEEHIDFMGLIPAGLAISYKEAGL